MIIAGELFHVFVAIVFPRKVVEIVPVKEV